MTIKYKYQKISGYFFQGLTLSIVLLYSFSGCTGIFKGDWRQEYMKQEKKRIITYTRRFEYDSGNFKLESIDSSFKSFNEEGQLLGNNDLVFYQYDSTGKLISIQSCGRSCDYYQKEIFTYDSLNRLIKSVVIVSPEKQYISNQYFYNENDLVIKHIRGVIQTQHHLNTLMMVYREKLQKQKENTIQILKNGCHPLTHFFMVKVKIS